MIARFKITRKSRRGILLNIASQRLFGARAKASSPVSTHYASALSHFYFAASVFFFVRDNQYKVPTITEPPTIFPKVTGIRFWVIKVVQLRLSS